MNLKMMNPAPKGIAKLIDHTLLKPEATEKDIKRLCEEAKKFGFASACVNPIYVSFCKQILNGSDVKVCSVVDFPLGANKSEVKALQASSACKDGADELDMVAHIGALKSGNLKLFEEDIKTVIKAKDKDVILKVIIETAVLTDEEKKIEELVLDVFIDDGLQTPQPDWIVANTMMEWIHHAYMHGDPTYKEFTDSSPLFPSVVTYHEKV